MILDRRENALQYLGMSRELDAALRFVAQLQPERLEVGARASLLGEDVYYSVGEPTLTHRDMTFEYHLRFADVHVPITGTERIALCPASTRPEDTAYDAQKDVGFFAGNAVNIVDVPAGWFCLCLPDDAHVPCMCKSEERAILKVVVKAKA